MTPLKPILTHGFDWLERYHDFWDQTITKVREKLPYAFKSALLPQAFATDVPILLASSEHIKELLTFLKEECGFSFLSDLTATDEMPRPLRFDVIYQLFNMKNFARIRIKIEVNEEAFSVVDVFKAANWAEREVFDMFGITFVGHPHLRRILMHDQWQGHPLRKDYPLKGYQIYTESTPPSEQYLKEANR
jgi:NADH-quinone oxidoreductase subunit C